MISSFADEYDYMIHLAACAVRGLAPSEKPDGLSFAAVYRRAMEHDLAGLTFYSAEKLSAPPPEPLYRKWSDRRGLAFVREINQSAAADGLREAFEKKGISYRELQGTRLKSLYPSPDMRTMSDIDFIVSPDDLGRAADLLCELGFEYRAEEGGKTITAGKKPDIYVEVHTSLFADNPVYENAFDGLDLSGELSLCLFTLLHAANHMRAGGCGARRLLDLYLLGEKYPEITASPELAARLSQAGERGLASALTRLGSFWFGDEDADPKLGSVARYVKRSGLHGTFENKTRNSFAASGDRGRAGYLLRRAFPPRRNLQNQYPALAKRPYLYPCYALRRLASKRREAAAELSIIRKAGKKDTPGT